MLHQQVGCVQVVLTPLLMQPSTRHRWPRVLAHGGVRPTPNPLLHVSESDPGPKSVDDWSDGKATVLEWIKAFGGILRQERRFGTEKLLGPGRTLLHQLIDLRDIIESLHGKQLEIILGPPVHACKSWTSRSREPLERCQLQ